jgi:putative membrane protein
MRKLAAPIAVALALSACGGKPGDDSNDAITVENGTTAQLPSGPAPTETKGQDFVSVVLGQYEFALASAKLLGEKAESGEGKRFARKMTADFGASLNELKAIATAGKLKLEPVPGPVDQSDLAVLTGTSGVNAEKAFADQQLNRLSELLGLIRAYKNGGDNAELKAWAEKAQNTVNESLLAVQTLKAELDEKTDTQK